MKFMLETLGRYEVDFVAIDAKQNIKYYQVSLTNLDDKT